MFYVCIMVVWNAHICISELLSNMRVIFTRDVQVLANTSNIHLTHTHTHTHTERERERKGDVHYYEKAIEIQDMAEISRDTR